MNSSDSREVLTLAIAYLNDGYVDLFDLAYRLYRRGEIDAEMREELTDLCISAESALVWAREKLSERTT